MNKMKKHPTSCLAAAVVLSFLLISLFLTACTASDPVQTEGSDSEPSSTVNANQEGNDATEPAQTEGSGADDPAPTEGSGWKPSKTLTGTDKVWVSYIREIVEKYDPEARSGETVFYGASNFARWETMEEDLVPYLVQNHAFGGSTDRDLSFWADDALFPYNPKIVFFQTGSNDYAQSQAETDELKIKEAMDFKKVMFAEFHEKMPEAKFVIMSGILLPGRAEFVDMTLEINDQLKQFCDETDYMYYVDAEELTYSRETGEFVDGVNDLFVDDLIHLTPEARITWANNWIIPMLEELNAPKAE